MGEYISTASTFVFPEIGYLLSVFSFSYGAPKSPAAAIFLLGFDQLVKMSRQLICEFHQLLILADQEDSEAWKFLDKLGAHLYRLIQAI